MAKTHNIHDSFFKSMMSHLDFAVAFLKVYLPKSIINCIDWNNLQLFKFNPESTLGKLIGSRSADMVYTTKLDGSPGYLICHAEHQSTLNEETYLRAEIYSRLIYIEHRKMHPKSLRPAIVSVVYFHGKENTKNYPTCFDDLKPPKPFDKYFLKPLFINVNDYSDEQLKKHGKVEPADLIFKYSIKEKPSMKIIDHIFKSLKGCPTYFRENSLYYMSEQFDVSVEKLFNQARKYFEEGDIMTAADQLRAQGREQRNTEIARNLLNEGIPANTIKKATGLSVKEIKSLQEKKDQ